MSVDLIASISASTGLAQSEAQRVIDDVLAYYRESTEDVVRRRHRELQQQGRRNPEILTQIASELQDRLVAAPALSQRQLRRMIYT